MEKNKKIIIGVIIAVIIIGITSFVVYMEFGGYYHNNDMYNEDFGTGKKIATISDIDNYNLNSLDMYLSNSLNQSSVESYETIDYYVYYYYYYYGIESNLSDIYRDILLTNISNYYGDYNNIPDDYHTIILSTINPKYHDELKDTYIDSINIIVDKKTGEVSINSIIYGSLTNN